MVPLPGTLEAAICSLKVSVSTSPVARIPSPLVLEMPVSVGAVVSTFTVPDAPDVVVLPTLSEALYSYW